MKKQAMLLGLIVLLGLFVSRPAWAQAADELKLSMSRDFGYGGFGEIQGLFTLKASGPDTLQKVVFLIDGETMAEDAEAPFRFQFTTDNYPVGQHTLSAAGYTSDGRQLQSNTITVSFVSAGKANQSMLMILVPVGVLVVLTIVLATIVPMLQARRRGKLSLGQPRNYGILGGAICPRCQRPFALSILGFNLGPFGKLSVCPHCGKWGFMRHRSLDELRAAEQAELALADEKAHIPELSEEEKLRKSLDDSRYRGM